MPLEYKDLKEGYFIRRDNRFIAMVNYRDKELRCHLPNPGRMKELLKHGSKVFIQLSKEKSRKTDATLIAVEFESEIIQLHTLTANRLFHDVLTLPSFNKIQIIRPEVTIGKHRFDYLVKNIKEMIIEIKSTTLVINNIACFPDAVTSRGTSHLKSLTTLASTRDVMVVFMVFRKANTFRTCKEIDPVFSSTFEIARERGVKIIAILCESKLIKNNNSYSLITNIVKEIEVL